MKFTYMWNFRDWRHLYLIFSLVIRIVGKRFCCTLESSPQEDALCSKASDKHTLILT